MKRLGVDAALIGGELVGGDVAIDAGRVDEVALPAAGRGLVACAGFVDLQVNGFGGVDFATADVAGYQRAAAAMAATGVTTFLPTFISLPWNQYEAAIDVARRARPVTPGMAGLHLEGPFLAAGRCGAHDPANLVAPTETRLESIISQDVVNWVTVAPEVPGGLEAVHTLAAAAKTVAIGHSDASAATAHAAFEAGATAVTHLFNAQSPLHHRAPGIPGVALDDERVLLTIIADGVHLAPELVRLVFAVAPTRVALITDSIAVAGMGEGTMRLGERTVTVSAGAARLADGTLAGSAVTMDQAVRNAVDSGVAPELVLGAATAAPARALNGAAVVDLSPGAQADVVVLDADFSLVRTLRAGRAIYEQ